MPPMLLHLPNELLFAIAKCLPLHDLGSLRLTSRNLNSIFTSHIHQELFSDKNGNTPILHWAAYRGYGELVKLALSMGISIETRDVAQRTAIHFASNFKDPSMVELLLENGADIDSKDEMGQTALFKAVSWGLRKTVKVLLEHGADASLRDIYGETALSWAAEADLRMLWVVDRALLKRRLLRCLLLLPEKASPTREGAASRRGLGFNQS